VREYVKRPLISTRRLASSEVLGPLYKVSEVVEYEVLNVIVSSLGAVLTKWVGRCTLERDGITITAEFPVMGTFVVEEGSDGEWVIRQWRDYLGIQQFLAQLPEELHAPEVTDVG